MTRIPLFCVTGGVFIGGLLLPTVAPDGFHKRKWFLRDHLWEQKVGGIGLLPVWGLRRGGVSCRAPPLAASSLLSTTSAPCQRRVEENFLPPQQNQRETANLLSVCYSETFLWPQTLPIQTRHYYESC